MSIQRSRFAIGEQDVACLEYFIAHPNSRTADYIRDCVPDVSRTQCYIRVRRLVWKGFLQEGDTMYRSVRGNGRYSHTGKPANWAGPFEWKP